MAQRALDQRLGVMATCLPSRLTVIQLAMSTFVSRPDVLDDNMEFPTD